MKPDFYELSLDENSIYGSELGDYGSTLKETVPRHIALLELISHARQDHPESLHPVKDFQKRQDDDLNTFMQDPSFSRLGCIKLRGRMRWYNEAVAKMHGWEVIPHRSDTGRR